MDDTQRKAQLLNAWLGFNSDQKNIRKLLEERSTNRPSSPQEKQKNHAENFNRLAAFMRQAR